MQSLSAALYKFSIELKQTLGAWQTLDGAVNNLRKPDASALPNDSCWCACNFAVHVLC